MKILQVNSVYKKGSTGKIVQDIHSELIKHGIESVVCYGRGEIIEEPGVYKVCPEWYSNINHAWARTTGLNFSGFYLSTSRLIKIIKKENPDVVHLQCLNGFFVNVYKLLHYLSERKIKTVLTLHAEFMFTGTCGYSIECIKWIEGCRDCDRYRNETHSLFDRTYAAWVKMRDAFSSFDGDKLIITSVSPWLQHRAMQSPFLSRFKHLTVFNGLNDEVFNLRKNEKDLLERVARDRKICLFVSAFFNQDPNDLKGGSHVVEIAKMLPDIQFIIVASIYDDTKNLPSNVLFWGKTKDQEELAKLYNLADLTIITSKKETFSMIIAESLCCGTPVVGYLAGGPESIAIPKYCTFVEYGNTIGLKQSIELSLSKVYCRNEISKKGIEKYSKTIMASEFIKAYSLLDSNNQI